ncbi:MAG: hypothetical protein K5650_07570 [Bacteroidales bacterium]|nr:hypothetical protein [Bacteroidales bacterium]
MNITREKLNDLDLSIKVEIEENDYNEAVTKSLKRMQQNAVEPGFRKGKAPMALISRKYRSSIVADEVQRLLSDSIFKYVKDENLDIFGYPITNDEKTPVVDFDNQTTFTFFLDAALKPSVTVAWDKVDAKLPKIKVSKKEIDENVANITRRHGNFETPDTICEGALVYGKAEELDKKCEVKEGGLSTYAMFQLEDIKDEEIRNSLIGKSATDTLTIDTPKAFDNKTLVEKFRMTPEQAKAFKAPIRFTCSSCSRITPAEINEELFEKAFPGRGLKTEKEFRKAISDQIAEFNSEQSRSHYTNKVYKTLVDNFDDPIPEQFLKRWICRTNEIAADEVEKTWNEKYLPSIKWELIQAELEKIKPLEPTQDDIVNYIKKVLDNGPADSNETPEQHEQRITEAAKSIAKDRENVRQVVDRLYSDNLANLFIEQLKPEVEEMTPKQFNEL